ncbi:hypothetical protein [Actinomycetospora chlora]|uniref:hypothetical protein n=1 Tax=Actinomycetospora chlora TaxID=663608 RepID=UPI0031EFBF6B
MRSEYSFTFIPADDQALVERCPDGRTSILLDDLQIEIGLPRQEVLFAWGLHPHTLWRERLLEPPEPVPGVVRVSRPTDLEPGTAIEADGRRDWTTEWDPGSGWLRIAGSEHDGASPVEVATNVVLTLEEGRLRSVWLAPAFVDS